MKRVICSSIADDLRDAEAKISSQVDAELAEFLTKFNSIFPDSANLSDKHDWIEVRIQIPVINSDDILYAYNFKISRRLSINYTYHTLKDLKKDEQELINWAKRVSSIQLEKVRTAEAGYVPVALPNSENIVCVGNYPIFTKANLKKAINARVEYVYVSAN